MASWHSAGQMTPQKSSQLALFVIDTFSELLLDFQEECCVEYVHHNEWGLAVAVMMGFLEMNEVSLSEQQGDFLHAAAEKLCVENVPKRIAPLLSE